MFCHGKSILKKYNININNELSKVKHKKEAIYCCFEWLFQFSIWGITNLIDP